MKAWAAKIGPRTAEVAEKIFATKEHPEQAYRSVLGLIRLSKSYTEPRLEAACAKALAIGSPAYRTILTMLKNRMESVPMPGEIQTTPAERTAQQQDLGLESQTRLAKQAHPLVRGKGYYH